jgi:ribose transport system ATP-binding protein
VLLFHESTQGVDIGSRIQIFQFIKEAALAGIAVVIASSDYEDFANLCDRVVVLSRGKVVAELTGEQLTDDHIVECCLMSA